jgi:hypothetical protein
MLLYNLKFRSVAVLRPVIAGCYSWRLFQGCLLNHAASVIRLLNQKQKPL